MRIVIIEQGQREYLLNTFAQHPKFEAEISCFAEWMPKTQAYGDIPIIPLSELKNEHYDAVLIAVKWNHHLSQLLTYLHDEAVTNIYVIRLFALDTQADFIAGANFDMTCVDKIPEGNENPYLVHLETHVCDHCNLNCKACNNFSPFVNERCVTDVASFKKDMEHLSGLFSNIGRLFLLGGEPMLEPDISCEMIKISRRYFPNSELRLLTNGTLITKMSSNFWNCLREYGVIIHISVYPPIIEKLDEIEKILKDNKIVYLLAKRVEKFGKRWTLYPFEDAGFNNKKCGSAGCHYLRNGVLSKCADGILIGKMANQLNCEPEALMDRSSISLYEVNGAWDILRKLNDPCDLCKRCTHHRLEWIPWGSAGTSLDPADWIVENRLEYENRKLKKQLNAAEHRTLELKGKLNAAEHRTLELKGKLSEKTFELSNKKQQFDNLNKEYHAIQQSKSFKLGRIITWLPRKLRGGIRCLKEHGIKYTINLLKRKTVKMILPESIQKFKRVLAGYHIYSSLIKKYGDDVTILSNAIRGTGDYYICGLYLKTWLKKHNISNYVFLTMEGSQQEVTRLFPVYKGHTHIISFHNSLLLRDFRGFVGSEKQNFIFLDHQFPFPSNKYHNISSFNLMGFRGWNIHDFYSYFGFKFSALPKKEAPQFENSMEELNILYSKIGLKRNKTVLVSPYSESNNDQFLLSPIFWENLVQELIDKGYRVFTNCAGTEVPIARTTSIFLPYKQTVPFLNEAGFFVGFRSGLCDIISTSSCKKIILHTHKTRFWPDGASLSYTGLNNMGLCDDAVELEITEKNKNEILLQIIREVLKK